MPPQPVPYAGLDALGGFFPLSHGTRGDGWRVGTDLIADLGDPVADYLERLQTDRVDIAGSLLVQGWAARLTAVHIGSVALTGGAPDLAADCVDLRLPYGRGLEVHVRNENLLDAEQAWRRLVDNHLAPLIDATHLLCRSGKRRLWGNVAAVRAGALLALPPNGSPDPPETARLGRWLRSDVFARSTCCGLVRLPQRPACGDCVLRFRPPKR